MKERGIIMSGQNPTLILEDRKTQTRRIMKPQPRSSQHAILKRFPNQKGCPYGVAGDRLWVRETWAAPPCYDFEKPRDLPDTLAEDGAIIYRAESPDYRVKELGSFWRSPYYMPRWASRITLEITKVRVERLQDITPEDCIAEGINTPPLSNRIKAYAELWDSLHGKGAWEKNPWVWVIEFKRI